MTTDSLSSLSISSLDPDLAARVDELALHPDWDLSADLIDRLTAALQLRLRVPLGTVFPTIDTEFEIERFGDNRLTNALRASGWRRWGDLRARTIADISETRNLGQRSVRLLLGRLIRMSLRPGEVAPGPPSSGERTERDQAKSARVAKMGEMRLQGATLDAIGAEFGVTRERVRQILEREGGPTRSDAKAARAARARREEDGARAEIEKALRPLLQERGPLSLVECEEELGFSPALLADYWPEDLAHMLVRAAGRSEQTWTDEAIFGALQDASLYEFPLTAKAYTELLRVGQVKGPSVPRIHQRFGGWAAACDAAGVEHGVAWREVYESRWGDDEIVAFVRDYLADSDWPNSAHRFDEWRREMHPDGPSFQTIRNRLGTWSMAKRMAFKPVRDANE
jgi:hypothetical protein